MEKSEFRAVIKHLYLRGFTPKMTKAELDEVHGEGPFTRRINDFTYL